MLYLVFAMPKGGTYQDRFADNDGNRILNFEALQKSINDDSADGIRRSILFADDEQAVDGLIKLMADNHIGCEIGVFKCEQLISQVLEKPTLIRKKVTAEGVLPF